jgi:hypothetical protein
VPKPKASEMNIVRKAFYDSGSGNAEKMDRAEEDRFYAMLNAKEHLQGFTPVSYTKYTYKI